MFRNPVNFLKGVLQNKDYSHFVVTGYFDNIVIPIFAKHNFTIMTEVFHSVMEEAPMYHAYDVSYLIFKKN